MESSTEILRKLLDERGVKYYDMQNRGIWFGISEDGKDHKYEAFEQTDGLIEIDAFDLTPEQAIAATLGNEQNPDGLPVGLTISDDGSLLDWRGENYVRQSIVRDVKRKPNGDVDGCETCGDDRFELIAKAKQKLLDTTNIDSSPDEIAVLDDILFRCWQMEWLDQLRDADTRWHELFGTPERAARTLYGIKCGEKSCKGCPIAEPCAECDELRVECDRLREKLRWSGNMNNNLRERIAELTAERDEWKAKAESALHENPYVGLVRGKHWERREASDYYCGKCGWKVTDHYSYCPECGGALHKASNKPDGKFDARKTAEMPETDATKEHIRDFDDTREQLEADVHQYANPGGYKNTLGASWEKKMLSFLDRQAAIDRKEFHSILEETQTCMRNGSR